MNKTSLPYLLLVVLIVGDVFGYLSAKASIPAPQSIADQIPILASANDPQLTDNSHILNRLDSLDGGQTKQWYCKHAPVLPGAFIWGVDHLTGDIFSPTSTIITTVGGETPKQLGYSQCTFLPQ